MDQAMRLLGGAGIGAALMYFLDPQQGRRRRALVRDQMIHLSHEARDAADVVARDAANRAGGVWSEARALVSGRTQDDRILAERIRSHLGRCVSHPRAITVVADNGTATVSGPILAEEVDELIATVKGVAGVKEVINRLEVHDSPGQHTSLQGGVTRTGARSELCQANWSPTMRALTGAIGGGLLVNCLAQRTLLSAVLGTVGFGLFLRAATNTGLGELIEDSIPEFPISGSSELWPAAAAGPVL
jgi:hypothetical protein